MSERDLIVPRLAGAGARSRAHDDAARRRERRGVRVLQSGQPLWRRPRARHRESQTPRNTTRRTARRLLAEPGARHRRGRCRSRLRRCSDRGCRAVANIASCVRDSHGRLRAGADLRSRRNDGRRGALRMARSRARRARRIAEAIAGRAREPASRGSDPRSARNATRSVPMCATRCSRRCHRRSSSGRCVRRTGSGSRISTSWRGRN